MYLIDVNICGKFVGTPLHIACQSGNLNAINMLLKHGAEPNVCDNLTLTPLYYALKEGKNDVAKMLFENGAKHNQKTLFLLRTNTEGRRWTIIGPALLFGAIEAILAAMEIIPEIVTIGVIATAVLSRIAGAVVGGIAGYLVEVAINQCCSSSQSLI